MAFEKDSANTRKVTATDGAGVDLDGHVRNDVWDIGTTAWVRQVPGFPSGATVTVTGGGQATVNINGIPTVNVGAWPTLNVGNTVNLGTVPTVNVGNTVNLGTAPTMNVGNTLNVAAHAVTVTGNTTSTVNIGSIPTVIIGQGITATVNLGSIGTINIGNTVTIAGTATVNVGAVITATVNLGSIGTINVGNSVNLGTVPTINVGNTVNVANFGKAAITIPAAAADAANVNFMGDKYGRLIVSRTPPDLNESAQVTLTSSANTQILAGISGQKHYVGTIGACMTLSVAGPTTLRIKDGGASGAVIWAWTFTGGTPNMTPIVFDPVYANTTASFQITADLTASTGGLAITYTGFKAP